MLCMTEEEFLRIRRYIDEHDVEPIDYGKARCCFSNADSTCMVREVRPQACRLYNRHIARRSGTGAAGAGASGSASEDAALTSQDGEDLWIVDMHESFLNNAMDGEEGLWRSWSASGQTPAFLAATRMASLDDRNIGLVLERLQIRSGMRVLDVGCGSGEYCFRLGSQVEGVSFTGLDHDDAFVRFSKLRAEGGAPHPFEQPNPANSYEFVCADAARMPFQADTFDIVVSHTFLTATASWQRALREMQRVCKPAGTVSSITSLTDDFYGTGSVRLFGEVAAPDDAALVARVDDVFARAFPEVDLISGIAPRDVPAAFAGAGFENISCIPLGHYFCLSDAALPADDYRRYVDLLRMMEDERVERLLANPAARLQLPEEDWQRFGELIGRRHAELIAAQGANAEWSWYGNASIMVSGTAPEAARRKAQQDLPGAAPVAPSAPRKPRLRP